MLNYFTFSCQHFVIMMFIRIIVRENIIIVHGRPVIKAQTHDNLRGKTVTLIIIGSLLGVPTKLK